MLYRSSKIYVDDSDIHGRGVFASEFIKSGEIYNPFTEQTDQF